MLYHITLFLMLIVPVLVNIAFFTLMERKILGLSQARKGPNKVSVWGLLQPMADAVKLFLKEFALPSKANLLLFNSSPILALFLMMWLWALCPMAEKSVSHSVSLLLLLMFLGLNLYPLLISGWSSNSKYAMIGAMRGIAQTISYEISLALLLLAIVFSCFTFSVPLITEKSKFIMTAFLFFPLAVLWLVSAIAETNRTPFDFAEGESELVSGFNIEYGSVGFALIFMAEYGSIMFLSTMTIIFFLSPPLSVLSTAAGSIGLCFLWVWVRTTFPRYRYDKLMNLAWKFILPLTLVILFYYFSLSIV